jgi:hypothetical protein
MTTTYVVIKLDTLPRIVFIPILFHGADTMALKWKENYTPIQNDTRTQLLLHQNHL